MANEIREIPVGAHTTEPETPARVPSAAVDRPNVEWWQQHGGQEWLEEVERRRPAQARYDRQEAWVTNHFACGPSLSLLDFGCGYGRHLKNLRQLGHLELYGCDLSPTMVGKVGEYVGDASWAKERVRLIAPRALLPYPDQFFDVVMTSEVLIHVSPEDLPAVLAELVRVAFERLVLIENKRVEKSRLGTMAHGGCWLHDFPAALAELGLRRVTVLQDVLADQDIYLVDLERGADTQLGRKYRARLASSAAEIERLRKHAVREATLIRAVELEDALARAETELAERRARQARIELELATALERRVQSDSTRLTLERRLADALADQRRLGDEVARLDGSLARRVVKKAKRFEGPYRLVRELAERTEQALRRPAREGAAAPAAPEGVPPPALPFKGIARCATPSTPEAFLAAAPRVVGICHPDWRGIRASTIGLCEGVLQIEEVATDAHADAIAAFLRDARTQVVVIQGIPPGSHRLAIRLRKALPKLRILNVFHGSTAQQTYPGEAPLLESMIELVKAGVVDGLGFVKVGIAECLRREGLPAFPVYNRANLSQTPPQATPFTGGPLHVGVFVPTVIHKNINTQVMAALAIPNAIVHVNEAPTGISLERYRDRVVVHGLLPHAEFLKKLGEMDANLYVTLSECYPMTVIESLERGVVCLTSHTSPIFDENEALRRALVVTMLDDPWAIACQLEAAVANREAIVASAHEHLRLLNEKASRLWEQFVDG